MCYSFRSILVALTLLTCGNQIYTINTHQLLLVVSFDGFRYNYFERNLTQELVKLRYNGTYSEFMTSVFPTKTFPNHFTIGTGMYVDVHGVLDNKVFDLKQNMELKYSYDLFHYNKDITPIWTLNEREGNGRHSGCMMWPGSDYEYQGTVSTFFQKYNVTMPWEERVDIMLSWFVDADSPINLGMMYFEQPDLIMHSFGPDSPQVNKELERVNSIVKYLIHKLEGTELWGKLNVIMLSDHGAQAVPYKNIIDLNKYLSNSTYSMYGVSPNLQIYPQPGKFDEVLLLLRNAANETGHFSVFTKDEIYDRWHYKDNARCPPIFLVADPSYVFHDKYRHKDKLMKLHNTSDLTNETLGTHGYDPLEKNMRAFFLAFGPLIKRNHTIPPFLNIDLYPLFAKLLELELPKIKPNGSISPVEDMLNLQHYKYDSVYLVAGVLLCTFGLTVVISFIVVHIRRLEKQRKISISFYSRN